MHIPSTTSPSRSTLLARRSPTTRLRFRLTATLGAEYFTLAAGTDLAPLLEGLDGDACHAPHWGYTIVGQVVVTYTDGTEETCRTGDVFFWPAGHSVRVEEDAELVLFSPQDEHGDVMDHILTKIRT